MNNQQSIKQIENQINNIQQLITNYKHEIKQYEKTLADLTQQVTKLKNSENNKKNIK